MSDFIISHMTREEVNDAVEWAAKEGWNPGLRDADAFYAVDPQGFFCGKIAGEKVGQGSALVYDKKFAFCGFFIVQEKDRGKGYGMAITRARLRYIGDRNAGIDGVVSMVEKYKKIGYRTAHRNVRYGGTGKAFGRPDPRIVSVNRVEFGQLAAYDGKHFPALRESFLKLWIQQPEGAALAYIVAGKIKGYGVVRACRVGFKIGPLFADDREIAAALFQALSTKAQGVDLFLDTPEPNREAAMLAENHGMKPVFETSRMYLKEDPCLPLESIFGITSFEAG